jgi:hypothetical protein
MLGNTLLVVGSLLLFFAVAELVTRLTWKEHTHGLYEAQPDQMHLKPNTEGTYKTPEFEFRAASNRFGRRDWEWNDAVMLDSCGIVFVGDSFVFGYGVDDQDTVPTLLEKELEKGGRKAEVFNFGLGGGLPEYRKLVSEAIGMSIQAKTILVGIFLGNDFSDTPVYQTAKSPDSASQISSNSLRLSASAFYRFLKLRISSSPVLTAMAFRASKWLGLDLYPSSAAYIFLREWSKDQATFFYSLLDITIDIQRIAKEHQRELVFVIFPNKVQVENAADLTSAVYEAALPDQRILKFCAAHGLSCLDLLPVLSSAYERDHQALYFPVDRHMNSYGNRLAAEAIWKFLRASSALCSN